MASTDTPVVRNLGVSAALWPGAVGLDGAPSFGSVWWLMVDQEGRNTSFIKISAPVYL